MAERKKGKFKFTLGPKEWFGVYTLYLTYEVIKGKPKVVGSEERVVMFKAHSDSEATEMAKKEAREYANHFFTNGNGNRGYREFLETGQVAIFSYKEIKNGSEVYAKLQPLSPKTTPQSFVQARLGKSYFKGPFGYEYDGKFKKHFPNKKASKSKK